MFLFQFLLGEAERFGEVFLDFVESLLTFLFAKTLFCSVVNLLVEFVVDALLEFGVGDFRLVGTFNNALLLRHFLLEFAERFDGVVRSLDGFEHFGFRNLVHLAFHHKDVFVCCAHNHLDVSLFALFVCGVDYNLAVHPCHANLCDGFENRHVAHAQCARSGKTGVSVGHSLLVGGEEIYIYESLRVIVFWEQRPQSTVNEPCGEDFGVGRLALAFEEAAGESAVGIIFFLILYCERHEVSLGVGFFCGANGSEQHRVALPYDYGTVCLFGEFAGLNAHDAAVAKVNFFCDNVHSVLLFLK